MIADNLTFEGDAESSSFIRLQARNEFVKSSEENMTYGVHMLRHRRVWGQCNSRDVRGSRTDDVRR